MGSSHPYHSPSIINSVIIIIIITIIVVIMNTLHLKYPLVLFGSEGCALILPLILLSPRIIIMIYHCSSTMTNDHFLIIVYATREPLFINVPLNTHSFIHSSLSSTAAMPSAYLSSSPTPPHNDRRRPPCHNYLP